MNENKQEEKTVIETLDEIDEIIESVEGQEPNTPEATVEPHNTEVGSVSTNEPEGSEKLGYTVVDGYEVATTVTTDQVKKKAPNPSGKGGFGDNPQNRNPGGWKKEDTARFKLEQIMKFTDKEHIEFQGNEDTPTFEKRLSIAVQNGNWKEIDGMINQIYGKPQERVDITTQGDSVQAPLVRIIDERQPDRKPQTETQVEEETEEKIAE